MTPQEIDHAVHCRIASEDIAKLLENHRENWKHEQLIGAIKGILKDRMGEYRYYRASGRFNCEFGGDDLSCGCGSCSALSAMLEAEAE